MLLRKALIRNLWLSANSAVSLTQAARSAETVGARIRKDQAGACSWQSCYFSGWLGCVARTTRSRILILRPRPPPLKPLPSPLRHLNPLRGRALLLPVRRIALRKKTKSLQPGIRAKTLPSTRWAGPPEVLDMCTPHTEDTWWMCAELAGDAKSSIP